MTPEEEQLDFMTMSFEQFLVYEEKQWKIFRAELNDEWRHGQHFFNTLYKVRPDLANQVRGSFHDPFYQNDNLFDCRKWLKKNW
jgi:hypothetical protein